MPVWKRFPLPSGLGLLSPLPWPLEFDGFRGRDSTGGIQLQVHLLLWLPADQWVEADLGRVAGTWIQAQEKQEEKKTSHWAAVCSNYASWAKTGLSRGHQWAGWSSPVSSLFTALLLMHSCLFSHLFWGFVFFCLILNFPNKAFYKCLPSLYRAHYVKVRRAGKPIMQGSQLQVLGHKLQSDLETHSLSPPHQASTALQFNRLHSFH